MSSAVSSAAASASVPSSTDSAATLSSTFTPSSKPARVHMRDPSFVNLQALPDMARDSLIADFIACVAMLDPILGGVDR